MNATSQSIINWLSQIPATVTYLKLPSKHSQTLHLSRKRRLPSPPMSNAGSAHAKRPCLEDHNTPTQNSYLSFECLSHAGSNDWSSTGSSPSKRTRGGRGSPTKGQTLLQLAHIIKHQTLSGEEEPPEDLLKMVRLIRRDAMGLGIVTSEDQVRETQYYNKICPSKLTLSRKRSNRHQRGTSYFGTS